MASDEANAIKDVASRIKDLGNVGSEIDKLKRAVETLAGNLKDVGRVEREIDQLKRAVEGLTGELKEVRKFAAIKDVIGDTNDNLAKIADELRRIRKDE
jgi:septation ring formation regulator EzrA